MDRFFLLSEKLEGEILAPIWSSSGSQVETMFGPGSYPTYKAGRFQYHWLLCGGTKGLRAKRRVFWFYVRQGLKLHKEKKFDSIVVYSHQTTALIAILLKLLTGGRLITEIATTPHLVGLVDRPRPTLRDRLIHAYNDVCLYLASWFSECLHLLSPDQLAAYKNLRYVRGAVFHEYVPLRAIERKSEDVKETDPFILLVGAPWYLKGADLLIKAFLGLAEDFNNVKLKILGHFPDRCELEALASSSERIEILQAKPYLETLAMISSATVLVLPSRCEGMGRVLVEAMAAGVPVIGSRVGGIPYIIRDGENGLLFPPGDAAALEDCLRRVLSDPGLRRELAESGYKRAHAELDERNWVEKFAAMVHQVVESPPTGHY